MDKLGLKRLCTAIVGQCVVDLKSNKIDYSESVKLFLGSEWGELVTGIVGIDAKKIDKALNVSERAELAREAKEARHEAQGV